MVRINLINPRMLADQHLVAEYDEILMLLGYVRRYPSIVRDNIPKKYKLGEGHMLFFKDKLVYLKRRHESLKREMQRRGFATRKSINLKEFPNGLCNDWHPSPSDIFVIKKRIVQKIESKPDFYRYCRKKKSVAFLVDLIKKA